MGTASIHEIRQQLKDADKKELVDIIQKLVRYKKENKELVHFILLESHDLQGYLTRVKDEVDEIFASTNQSSVFLAKKTLRKAIRVINKHIRFAADPGFEADLRLHYCTNFQGLKINWNKSNLLSNLYNGQFKKAENVIEKMHEDLQYDYLRTLERLRQ